MSFRPRTVAAATTAPSSPPPSPAVPTTSTQEEGSEGGPSVDLAHLAPSAETLSVLDAMPDEVAHNTIEDARTRAVRWMNALRLVAPALQRALAREAPQEAQAAFFATEVEAAHKMALAHMDRLGLDGQDRNLRWAVVSLQRGWLESGVPPEDSSEAWAETVSAVLDALPEIDPAALTLENVDMGTRVRLTLLHVLQPVLAAQSRFDFFRPADADMRDAATWLATKAQEGLSSLTESTDPDTRATTFHVCAEEAGRILATCWDQGSIRAQNAIQKQTKAQWEAWRRATPGGLPLDGVYRAADLQVHRLWSVARAVDVKPTRQTKPKAKRS